MPAWLRIHIKMAQETRITLHIVRLRHILSAVFSCCRTPYFAFFFASALGYTWPWKGAGAVVVKPLMRLLSMVNGFFSGMPWARPPC